MEGRQSDDLLGELANEKRREATHASAFGWHGSDALQGDESQHDSAASDSGRFSGKNEQHVTSFFKLATATIISCVLKAGVFASATNLQHVHVYGSTTRQDQTLPRQSSHFSSTVRSWTTLRRSTCNVVNVHGIILF